jgi:2-furoyl-CoA dehydrogenase 2Fe-2S iron sulfur subunit
MTDSILSRNKLHLVHLTLNQQVRTGHAHPRLLLTDFLRHELGATGTHVGCEHGACGACTVRVDGVASRACLMLAVQVDGRQVDTVEGLGNNGALSDLQATFKKHFALQCGFCTAGILMSCADWLEQQAMPNAAAPNESSVRAMLSGHICRCTGYTPIVQAVLDVVHTRRAISQTQSGSHA